jgi:hypothetical protein
MTAATTVMARSPTAFAFSLPRRGSGRPGEAQVDDMDALENREVDPLGEGPAAAGRVLCEMLTTKDIPYFVTAPTLKTDHRSMPG